MASSVEPGEENFRENTAHSERCRESSAVAGSTHAHSVVPGVKRQRGQTKNRSRQRTQRFASVEHLGPEAIAAFVDGELDRVALHRARVHLVQCPECREEVERQRRAAEAIQYSNTMPDVQVPMELLARLTAIANSAEHCSGPDADSVPIQRPRTLMDKVEVLVRTVRKGHRAG